jgi:hypothetical protein
VQLNPGITAKSLSEHFDQLLYNPLRSLDSRVRDLLTAVIIVDAWMNVRISRV